MEKQSFQSQTIRQAIVEFLKESPASVREISKVLSIREKEIYDHLAHVDRSLTSKGTKLTILPAQCLSCGYLFENRKRLNKPGRCPICKKSRIEAQKYLIK